MDTGGMEKYSGMDVPTVHKGMNISEKEFLSVVDDFMLVLENHEVSDQTKKDMLYVLYSFKGQVIGL
jgi:hemoglobin